LITFTVHEEPEPRIDILERGERLEFVREGFSLLTAYLAPFWLLANRLWLVFAGYLGVVGLLGLAAWLGIIGQNGLSLGVMALHLVIGYEADQLKRWNLDRQGWTELGTVTGRNREECERRFLDAWLDERPPAAHRLGRAASAFASAGSAEGGSTVRPRGRLLGQA
jgi:hypothetical protein